MRDSNVCRCDRGHSVKIRQAAQRGQPGSEEAGEGGASAFPEGRSLQPCPLVPLGERAGRGRRPEPRSESPANVADVHGAVLRNLKKMEKESARQHRLCLPTCFPKSSMPPTSRSPFQRSAKATSHPSERTSLGGRDDCVRNRPLPQPRGCPSASWKRFRPLWHSPSSPLSFTCLFLRPVITPYCTWDALNTRKSQPDTPHLSSCPVASLSVCVGHHASLLGARACTTQKANVSNSCGQP